MRSRSVHRLRRGTVALTAFAAVAGALSGCTPTVPDDAWSLEALPLGSHAPRDIVFIGPLISADGVGGFWHGSALVWSHVDADGKAIQDIDAADLSGAPLGTVITMAASSPTELVVATQDDFAALRIIDADSMTVSMIPVGAAAPEKNTIELGFGDLHARDGVVHAVRYRTSTTPPPEGAADLEADIVRIRLSDASSEVIHVEPLRFTDSPVTGPDLPPIDLDVAADGRIFLATPTARVVLGVDGTELTRTDRLATWPRVSLAPDGSGLWWEAGDETHQSPDFVVSGSREAREVISSRSRCTPPFDVPTYVEPSASTGEALPFLCGADAVTWVEDAWLVSIGGEDSAALIRFSPPTE